MVTNIQVFGSAKDQSAKKYIRSDQRYWFGEIKAQLSQISLKIYKEEVDNSGVPRGGHLTQTVFPI